MTSFNWAEARKWGLNTFGFLCSIFVVNLVALSFIMWKIPDLNVPASGYIFRGIVVASALMAFVGGIED